MKKLLESALPKDMASSVKTNAITLDPPLRSIGNGNSVRLTTIHSDGRVEHEVIDAEVNEKRRRGTLQDTRNVRRRVEDDSTSDPPPNPPVARPTTSTSQNPSGDTPMANARLPVPPNSPVPTPTSQTPPREDPLSADPKFRLASNVREQIDLGSIAEKILKMQVNLEFREVLGMSPELSHYFVEGIRKRRRPVDINANANTSSLTSSAVDKSPLEVNVNAASTSVSTPLYACASPRANVLLEDTLKINSLVDHSSEICLMPRRVCEKLCLYLDESVEWTINTFDTGSKAEPQGPVGVCHRVKIDVGGVSVHLPVFIVEEASTDLLLGMPWILHTRAATNVEDDGSVTMHIKSLDGRAAVRWQALKTDHPRNRQFVRYPEEGTVGGEWGKM
jgi:hypothetical protein